MPSSRHLELAGQSIILSINGSFTTNAADDELQVSMLRVTDIVTDRPKRRTCPVESEMGCHRFPGPVLDTHGARCTVGETRSHPGFRAVWKSNVLLARPRQNTLLAELPYSIRWSITGDSLPA